MRPLRTFLSLVLAVSLGFAQTATSHAAKCASQDRQRITKMTDFVRLASIASMNGMSDGGEERVAQLLDKIERAQKLTKSSKLRSALSQFEDAILSEAPSGGSWDYKPQIQKTWNKVQGLVTYSRC